MNRRTLVSVALLVLCLGVSAASAQGVDLRYPVAYSDQTGPVYYQNTVLYGSTPTSSVSTTYAIDRAPYEPAPAYTPPAAVYTQPASTYAAPAPVYSQPAPTYVASVATCSQPTTVCWQTVAPICAQPCSVRQTVVTGYAPTSVAYAPRVAYTPTVAYAPTTACAATYVAAYNSGTYTVPAAVPGAPRVWVRPKVYVEGQPIRNLLRAITP